MFHKINEQLHNNHYYDDIPEEKRIKKFTFQYDPEYIEKLKKCFPKTNEKWDKNSSYTFQPYFVEQKARTDGEEVKPVKVIGADQ